MKICTKCSSPITEKNAIPRLRNKSGVDSICKPCRNERTRSNNYLKGIRRRYLTAQEYLHSKSNKEGDCVLWTGYVRSNGYAPVDAVRWGKEYKCTSAHQLSYILYKGDYDRSLCVCHTCHNRLCINPDHLYVGTHKDNIDDMVNAGRAAWQLRNKGRWKL